MKKIAFLLLISMLATAIFAGCGSKTSDNKSTTDSVATTQKVTVPPTTKPVPTTQEPTTVPPTTVLPTTVQPTTQKVIADPVDANWFDNSVFVGDSVSVMLSYYCDDRPEALGNAQFLCSTSLGYTNSQWDINDSDAVHPYYKGSNCLAEDCAVVTGAEKVFIMLGINDIGTYGVDGTMSKAKSLISKIKAKSPNVEIYMESITPILKGKEWEKKFTNKCIREFNKKMKEYCKNNGMNFLDLYSEFADDNGYLVEDYCSDPGSMGIHFTYTACEKWVNFLKSNVNK